MQPQYVQGYMKISRSIRDQKQTQFKPNSKPIAERVKLMQSVYLQRIKKKNAALGYEKTNPIQTQFLQRPKMNVNLYVTEDYENETAFLPQKNKPKQTQSKPICILALIAGFIYTLPASLHEKITVMESSGLKTCILGDYY